ncbi:MAG: GTP 3',8-cyclase MoaA [Phycisphaerales bacterium]|nr:GTP 3',8-cyclase MoaA [Phycisphaerales bacterium]
MSLAVGQSVALPILDTAPQRPVFAQGPRDLASVRLLRISVTDRCNLRCIYCMPEGGVEFSDKDELLQPADFEAIARVAVGFGVTHLKLTGGEPTIRRDIIDIAERLAALRPEDLSLTTNGLQLPRLAGPLRDAGVDRLTLSIDSLRPDRYERITGGGRLDLFWRGVDAATDAGFERLKFNVVVINGVNDDEVADFAALTRDHPWTVRFIEYMPLGESQLVRPGADPSAAIVDNAVIHRRIEAVHGPLAPVERATEVGVGPANVFRLPDARGRVGFISAMSAPFCATCNRLRLTATGELRSCLFDGGEVSMLPTLRPAPDPEFIARRFAECVVLKPDTHSFRGNRAMSQLGG